MKVLKCNEDWYLSERKPLERWKGDQDFPWKSACHTSVHLNHPEGW